MGVYKSTDFGASFGPSNTIDKKSSLNSTSINSLVFAPNSNSTLYAATAPGLYVSTDSAATWKLLLGNIALADVAVDPTKPSTIYAAGVANNQGKVVATADNGDSWKDLYSEPTSGDTVRSIAIDPKDHRHLVAGLAAGEIIYSVDAGITWQVGADVHDPILRLRYGPTGNLYILSNTYGLFESTDGGKSVTGLTGTLVNGFISINEFFSSVSKFMDVSFDLHQPKVIYLATDAGLVRTVDDGANWTFLKMPVRNSMLRTPSVGVNPTDSNNLYAVVENTMFISTNGGVTWQTKPLPTGWEVRQIIIDSSSPNVVYLGLGVSK